MSEEKDSVRRPNSFEECFPGRFLRAGLFEGKTPTLTILDVFLEDLPTDTGEMQTRGIISFKETPMQLSLNKTNGVCLRTMFGSRPALWIGKRVTFCCEQDKFGSKTVDAIRIKGSPDIADDVDCEVRMPKKKPRIRRLTKTIKGQKQETSQPEQSASDTNGSA